MIRVAVDAMGGDYAPVEMVKGAVDAVAKTDQIEIALVGKEDVVRRELEKYSYPKDRIRVVHASEVIETEEPPVNAIRKKKDSSIVVGMNMVKKQEADAFELRSDPGRRSGDRWKDQRGGTSAASTVNSYRKGSIPSDRLWG